MPHENAVPQRGHTFILVSCWWLRYPPEPRIDALRGGLSTSGPQNSDRRGKPGYACACGRAQ